MANKLEELLQAKTPEQLKLIVQYLQQAIALLMPEAAERAGPALFEGATMTSEAPPGGWFSPDLSEVKQGVEAMTRAIAVENYVAGAIEAIQIVILLGGI